MRKIIIKE